MKKFPHHSIIAMCFCAGILPPSQLIAEQTTEPTTPLVFDWSAEALNVGDLTQDLSSFYTVMHNSGQLRTTQIEVLESDETITDAMRRTGVWPAWIQDSNLLMDALLCDINTKCSRTKKSSSFASLSGSIDGLAPTAGNWTIRAGDIVTIPDYRLVNSYVTQVNPIAVAEGRPRNAVTTGDFDTMYCGAVHGACGSEVKALSWEQNTRPPIVYYDASSPNESAEKSKFVPIAIRDYYKSPNAAFELVAIPRVKFENEPEVSVTSGGTTLSNGTSLTDFKKSLGANALLPGGVQFEQGGGDDLSRLDAIESASFQLMNFSLSDDEKARIFADSPKKSLNIFHVDHKANFENCFFAQFQDFEFRSWKITYTDDVGIDPVDAAKCNLKVANKVHPSEHGTHTLGILAKYLSSGLFDSDDPLISIRHFSVEYDDAGNITNADKLLAFLGEAEVAAPAVNTIFSISMSWEEQDLKPISDKILSLSHIPFIVAAPRLENDDRCSRSPAALRVGNDPAKHIISVVAYDLEEKGESWRVGQMDGAGYGDTCHDFGAIGVGVGPWGADKIGVGKGSSQATPIAAAVAGHVLSMSHDRISPEDLAARLVSTGSYQSDLQELALGGMLDFGIAIAIEDDILHTVDDCKYVGKIRSVKLDTGVNASLSMKRLHHGSGSLPDVRARELLRLKRLTLDGELSNVRFWSVHETVQDLFSDVVEISAKHQRHRKLIFDVFETYGEQCKPVGIQEFVFSEVSDVINSKVGSN